MLRVFTRVSLLLFVLALLAGCASSHMAPVPIERQAKGPAPGKALVVFLRPSSIGGAVQSPLYDGDTYIGTLGMKSRIAYQAAPGKHMFMVTGESADFLEADLLPGKTYYTAVVPRIGVWKARFSFRPQNGQIDENELQEWLNATTEMTTGPDADKWAQENQAHAQSLKAEYLPKWHAKPDADKQRLHASSGR